MKTEQTAIRTSSTVAFLLLVIKIITGLMTGSIAVLASAVDSTLDFFVSLFNYIALKTSEKGADKLFNYGRGKIEALAAFIEGLVIILSGIYIIYESTIKLLKQEIIEFLGAAMLVMIISVVVTSGLVFFLNKVAKKTGNIVVEADALHYKTDLYTNVGILVSLGIISLTHWYIIDGIVGLCIGVYIIYSAYPIVKKGFFLVLDIAIPHQYVLEIEKILTIQKDLSSFHFLKTRQSGNTYFVQAHLVFSNPKIELLKAHDVADKIECLIAGLNHDKEWIIDFHLDPYDDNRFDDGNRVCSVGTVTS